MVSSEIGFSNEITIKIEGENTATKGAKIKGKFIKNQRRKYSAGKTIMVVSVGKNHWFPLLSLWK